MGDARPRHRARNARRRKTLCEKGCERSHRPSSSHRRAATSPVERAAPSRRWRVSVCAQFTQTRSSWLPSPLARTATEPGDSACPRARARARSPPTPSAARPSGGEAALAARDDERVVVDEVDAVRLPDDRGREELEPREPHAARRELDLPDGDPVDRVARDREPAPARREPQVLRPAEGRSRSRTSSLATRSSGTATPVPGAGRRPASPTRRARAPPARHDGEAIAPARWPTRCRTGAGAIVGVVARWR